MPHEDTFERWQWFSWLLDGWDSGFFDTGSKLHPDGRSQGVAARVQA